MADPTPTTSNVVGTSVTVPQADFYNDQETFSLDFTQLYNTLISAIDLIRSHYNALSGTSQNLNTPQYQESRCHAYFRMIGFPVVAANGTFHSPGYDPNINLQSASIATNATTDSAYVNDNSLTSQTRAREQVVQDFTNVWANGGLNSQAAALGSIFVRSFKSQFGNTAPLVFDKSQIQTITERVTQVTNYYGPYGFTNPPIGSSSTPVNLLTSRHLLKPFIVDPRIDGYIKPIKSRVCAPFLKDKSQTVIFKSSAGAPQTGLARPYIERVITVRFNGNNVTQLPGQITVDQIINQIETDAKVVDQDLIQTTSNTLGKLYNNELNIFNNYYKIIRVIIDQLVSSIRDAQTVRQTINFNPQPGNQGPETGVDGGGKLAPIDPLNTNNANTKYEKNIIFLSQKQALNNITFDTGLQGIPDPSDFVFSNLDDIVFSINKNIEQSYNDNIDKVTDYRNQNGNVGIEALKNIEIIMGEFSGLGLIDMVAIQAALWIMPANSLLGLIDLNAFGRITPQIRPDINLNGASQNDIMTSLSDFETTLKTIYLLIQDYYDSIYDGSDSSVP